jgi:DNA polymerase-3 subunit delta
MIVKSHEADRYVASPPKALTVALVYGPDAGLVQERAEKLLKSVVPDLTDAFNVSDLSEDVLLADPARLADEAAAISMFGGRRVVRVRGAGNDLAELLESFLDDPKGDALVVIEAGDLAKTGALRKLFDGHKSAAALQCYPDSARDLSDVVRDALRAEGNFDRAGCAGGRGVAAGLGPRRDKAGDRKAGSVYARPEASEPGRCARGDGR